MQYRAGTPEALTQDVWRDGRRERWALFADAAVGTVERYATDAQGRLSGEIETVRGRVEIRPHQE